MVNKDNTFIIKLGAFHHGAAPVAHLDSLTELGTSGQYSVAQNIDIVSLPGVLTQGPGLANLTNGTQAGVVSELINFIMDKAVSADATYGIGATKLFKISSTAVASGGTPSWPRTITGATDGESVIDLKGYLYYFYNKSSGADCGRYDLSSTFDDDYFSTVPTGAAALESAPHPVAAKEDIMVFGNGQYLGTFFSSTATLAPTKLDFGAGNQVDDVIFHANQWHIVVNGSISGTNRVQSNIYQWDGGAISSILADETAVGVQRIGFIYPLNGIIYVCFQDLSSDGGYKIGYVSGRQIKTLRSFTGSLPNFAQKTLYKDTILFLSSGLVYSAGAMIEQLPYQISQIADGGYATCGAIAAPFGTPLVASSDGGSNFRLAKFSGYDTACSWKSIVIPVVSGRMKGFIDDIIVITKTLGANASAALTIEADQASLTSSVKTITGTGKRRHTFKNFALKSIEDFRVAISWSGGNIINDCPIRQIQIIGHFVEN